MIELVTGEDIFNEITMTRQNYNGTIVVLEGDKDCVWLDSFIDSEHCITLPARGRENALNAITQVNRRAIPGILVIVDADFCHIDRAPPPPVNAVLTDFHDIEIHMIESQAFTKLVKEYCSAAKVESFVKKSGAKSLVDALYVRAEPLGLLRWLSHSKKWRLCFKELKHEKILEKKSLTLDLTRIVQVVYSSSKDPAETLGGISVAFQNTTIGSHDPRQLCCGHDVVAILTVGLRSALGSCDGSIADNENVERMLRLAYDSVELKKTQLFKAVKEWEATNKPFVVFAV